MRRTSTTARVVPLERRTLLSTLAIIAPFAGYDGATPVGAPVIDAAGNLFGCTSGGGGGAGYDDSSTSVYPAGTVFEVPAATDALTVLASFSSATPAVGLTPAAGPTLDAAGDLFGTTTAGGTAGMGTVWELPAGSAAVVALASFGVVPGGTADLSLSDGPLVRDAAGDWFGTRAEATGNSNGTLFELPAGTSTVVYRHLFTGADGDGPGGPLATSPDGSLYGATAAGGADGHGTVYRFDPATGDVTTVYTFTGGPDGGDPTGVVLTTAGRLAGTAATGGADGNGTLFDLDPATDSLAHVVPVTSATAGGLAASPAGTLYVAEPQGGTGGAGAFLLLDPATFSATTVDAPALPVAPNAGAIYDDATTLSGTTGLAVNAAGDVYGNAYVPPFDNGSGVPGGNGDGFTYAFAPAATPSADYLDIIQTPTFTPSGQPVTGVVKVAVVSAPHVIDRAAAGTVRLTSSVAGADLTGTVTAPIVNGIATISGLTVTDVSGQADAFYALSATDGVDAPAARESQPFGASNGGGAETNSLPASPTDVPASPVVLPAVVGSTLPALLPAGRPLGRRVVTVSLRDLAGWPKGTAGSVAVLASPDGTTVGAVELGSVPVELNARRAAVPITAYPATLGAGTFQLFARVTDPDGAEVVSSPGPASGPSGTPRAFTVGSGQAKLTATFAGYDGAEFEPDDRPAVVGVQLENTGTAPITGRFQVSLWVQKQDGVSAFQLLPPLTSPPLIAVRTVTARLTIRPGGRATIRIPVGRLAGVDSTFAFVAGVADPDGTDLETSTLL